MGNTNLYTIGFTKKSAKVFFHLLNSNSVKKLIDIRLNNVSQLAGFAKRDDLIFFLDEICDCDYRHEPMLAPTKEILDGYKKKLISWDTYEEKFLKLLIDRNAHKLVTTEELTNACLLCSEPTPEKCHRRLVSEYFKKHFPNISIIHI